jgi:hypothetical protein
MAPRHTEHPFETSAEAVSEGIARAGEEIVGPKAKDRLLTLARGLPADSHAFGFECRLTGDDPRVDLGVAIAATPGGRNALTRLGTHRSRRGAASWHRIAAFGRTWGAGGSALRAWVPFVFLEFDEESALERNPVPSVFVALDSPLEGSSGASPELGAALRSVELLAGEDTNGENSDSLRRAFSNVPGGGRVLHVGVMLGRPERSLRMSVLLPEAELSGYLRRLGHAVAAEVVAATLATLSGLVPATQLDFDLGSGADGRVGFGLRPAARSSETWRRLLDRLSESVSIPAARREAVLGWSGSSELKLAAGGSRRLLREISHVKLGCGPATQAQVKAYLGVTPLRIR